VCHLNPNGNTGSNVVNINNDNGKKKRQFIIIGIIVVVLLILLIFILSRGGGSNNNVEDQKENIVLQWWGAFLEPEVVQPLIDEYNSLNQHVTIEYANKFRNSESFESEVTRYRDELNRVLRNGNQVEIPDIFTVESTWSGDYEQYVAAAPSNTYTVNSFASTFYGAVNTSFTQGDKVIGVPLWIDTFAVVYNKDLLAQASQNEPPTTWSAFKTLATQLTQRSRNNVIQSGLALGNSSNLSYSTDILLTMLMQNGVVIADQTGIPQFANSSATLNTLEFYKSFMSIESGTWSNSFNNESAAFLDGKVAMIIVPSYRYREILRFNQQYNIGLNIGVSEIPQVDGSAQKFNWADYWGNMVALDRPNSSESWKFLHWITQPEQLRKLNDNVNNVSGYFGILYPRSDMAQELAGDTYLRVFNSSLVDARSWYMVKGRDVEEELKTLINQNSINQSTIDRAQENISRLISNKGIF
jgi:ABC-type glycerol-3-phosphate transport system substrate-binding protein